MTTYNKTVISLANLKNALIYFEYVIPLAVGCEWIDNGMFEEGARRPSEEMLDFLINKSRDSELFPPELRGNEKFLEHFRVFNMLMLTKTFDNPDRILAANTCGFLEKFLAHWNLTDTPIDIPESLVRDTP